MGFCSLVIVAAVISCAIGESVRLSDDECWNIGDVIKPGQTFRRDCNACVCRQGIAVCTEMTCPVKPGSCPRDVGPVICVDKCVGDNDCNGTQKCCSNGCGHVCVEADLENVCEYGQAGPLCGGYFYARSKCPSGSRCAYPPGTDGWDGICCPIPPTDDTCVFRNRLYNEGEIMPKRRRLCCRCKNGQRKCSRHRC